MKQLKLLIPLTAVFLISIGAMFLFRSRRDTPVEISDIYCEHYPDALVCSVEYPSEYDVVYDMFTMMLNEADGEIDDQFCDDHFTGKLQDYCVDDDIRIVPEDFYRISHAIGVIPKSDGQYLITTQYYDKLDAYQFYVDLKVVDGFYQFYGFSYKKEDSPVVTFNDEQLLTILDGLVANQQDDDYCQINYIEEAYMDCVELDVLFPNDFNIEDVNLESIGDNIYVYQVASNESSSDIRITMTFKEILDTVYIEDLSIIRID